MDYKTHYKKLITRAQNRLLEQYTEIHHIVPRCMEGGNDNSNLVKLTPEEHYLAHLLLCKMYPNNHRLAMAAMMMCAKRKSNKVYGWLRRKHAVAMSNAQSGESNSQYGTIWIHRDDKSLKIKLNEKDRYLNEGWNIGRKLKPIKKSKIVKLVGTNAPTYSWINEQEEQILQEFDKHRSVTKILQSRGFQNRQGNKILSTWLKSKGRFPLVRRNSAGVA